MGVFYTPYHVSGYTGRCAFVRLFGLLTHKAEGGGMANVDCNDTLWGGVHMCHVYRQRDDMRTFCSASFTEESVGSFYAHAESQAGAGIQRSWLVTPSAVEGRCNRQHCRLYRVRWSVECEEGSSEALAFE